MSSGRGPGKHLAVSQMALLAGKDLPWWQAIGARRHLRSCVSCRFYFEGLGTAQAALRREAEMQTLTGFEAIADFRTLEREMVGNISVGLAAARCVETAETRWPAGKKILFAGGLGALFVTAWWTHVPAEDTRQLVGKLEGWVRGEGALPQQFGTVMRSSPEGIAVRSQGATLTMQHPRSAVVSVAGSGSMEARFVDEETGQVTISSVYGQ